MTPLEKAIQDLLTLKKNKQTVRKQKTVNKTKTPDKNKQQTNIKTTTPTILKITSKTASKTPTPTMLKTPSPRWKTNTPTNAKKHTNFANHPDYEYDTVKNKWFKKSIRPIQLVNRYKAFLMDYLKDNTTLNPKQIGKIVQRHATSTARLKEMLVSKDAMTQSEADYFFKKNSFWGKELCRHMNTICPTETSLDGIPWCKYTEESLFLHNDNKTKYVSCYTLGEMIGILSSSLTGGGKHLIILQLPRDPYTPLNS